ncbi:MAG: pyrroline-5-carboxylate reductase [Candidatus Poriferisodalaceae bacterium]
MLELLIVGGGKMGAALLGGLLRNGHDVKNISVIEPSTTRAQELVDTYGVRVSTEMEPSEGSIIATKPDVVASVAQQVAEAGTKRLLSVAAGVTLAAIDKATGAATPAIRAMPNTPALVGKGAAAICGNAVATPEDLAWAEEILGAVGTVVRTEERLLDAVTGLSGSGPAYVFLVAEAMIDAGVMTGLSRSVATDLAVQTLLGASTLLAEGKPPAELRADVTSPGGTTAAGLRELENHGLRAAFAAAIEAASRRSQELGQD